MNIYTIQITETLQKQIKVEANNESEAIDIINQKYSDEEIVLDYNNITEANINIIE